MTPETRRQERRLAVFLALTLLVIAALTLLAFRSLREVSQASQDVIYDYSQRVIDVLELHVAAENKVSAVRGYLMTGNPFHVDRLNAARANVQTRLDELQRSVTTDRGRQLLAAVREKDAASEVVTERMARMKANGVPDRRR